EGTMKTATAPIAQWNNETLDYDAEQTGQYTFFGELDLDPSVENPYNIEAEITVVVSEYEWEENDTGITITGYDGTETNITIPDEINNKPVTIIGEDAFRAPNEKLTSVSLPDSVEIIESDAFHTNNLTSIDLPQN